MKVWCRTVRMRPGRTLTAIGVFAGLVTAFFVPTLLATQSLGMLAIAGAATTVFAAVVASRRLQRDLPLDIDPSSIEDAFSTGNKLVLHLKSGATIEVEPRDETPDAILEKLGLTLDQRALSAPLRGNLGGFTRGLLAFFGTWMGASCLSIPLNNAGITVIGSLLAAVVTTVLVVRNLRPRVIVGSDGLRIVGVLRPRFVPFARVKSVRVAAYGVEGVGMILVETDSSPVALPVVGQSSEQVAALVERIEKGRERWAAGGSRALDLLDRAGRSTREWLEALRKLPAEGGFRTAALDRTDLERVLADPQVALERRIGAALALRDDPAARKRVRVAAEQSAEPRVRVAPEAAAADDLDEAEIEKALEV